MHPLTKLTVILLSVAGMSFGVAATASEPPADPVTAQQAGPTISITEFKNEPADLSAKVGQAITVTNNDGFPHTVTANDGTFNVEVPAKATVTLTVPKAGSFPYTCTYHPGQHNPATITVS